MNDLPPWMVLCGVLLLLGALAAWVLRRGLTSQGRAHAALAMGEDVQAQALRRIQQQHLADLDRAWTEGRLSDAEHGAARDAMWRQLLADSAPTPKAGPDVSAIQPAWWVAAFLVLTGLSYLQLGAAQSWWPLPLSQRVQISATTPAQLAEQTRAWQTATQNRPDDAQAWLTLARLHAAQNAYDPAEQAFARALALSPEPDLWIERAQNKAKAAGGVYAGEPWQWIQSVLRAQPQHLNALVLAGTAAMSEQRHAAAQSYWQSALALVPAESEAAQGLQQALAQAAKMAPSAAEPPSTGPPKTPTAQATLTPSVLAQATAPERDRVLIQGQVRVSAQVQSHIGSGATLFVYALAEEGSRRPVAIWRGTPKSWPVAFALRDSMGMGAPPLLSDLRQVRLVARLSKTGAAQRQPEDWQVELPGVKTGVQGVVLDITER